MAEVKFIEPKNLYPNQLQDMGIGEYAVVSELGEDIVVLKSYSNNYQKLHDDDYYPENSTVDCRILPKGTVIQITV